MRRRWLSTDKVVAYTTEKNEGKKKERFVFKHLLPTQVCSQAAEEEFFKFVLASYRVVAMTIATSSNAITLPRKKFVWLNSFSVDSLISFLCSMAHANK